jgi:NAD(P)-dependent dehydrogenase (short-subunit alcohol dehydrogenase family)
MARMYEANPEPSAMAGNLLPVPFVEPSDVTSAVLYLISDGARYVTGTTLPIDAGNAVM